MPITGKDLIRELRKNGFMIDRINGSHYVMKKGNTMVVVPNHAKDLPKGTEMAIRKQAGMEK